MRSTILFVAVTALACRSSVATSPPIGPAIDPPGSAKVAKPFRCPAPEKTLMYSDADPTWEQDPLGPWPKCLETNDGARVRFLPDKTDVDGWRTTLVLEDANGTRFALPTRATSSMGLGPDGSIFLAHVESKITRVSPNGVVMWSTPHPYCGSPTVAVDHDGALVMACGYSLVKMSATGTFLWQKWPFGNSHTSKPWIARDGTMIVAGGNAVGYLDANGELLSRIDTGGNRYVHLIGPQPNGNLVFRTSMAAMHSDGPVHIYYPHEPDELFVITGQGKLLSRIAAEPRPPEWPASLPWSPDLRSGRLPW